MATGCRRSALVAYGLDSGRSGGPGLWISQLPDFHPVDNFPQVGGSRVTEHYFSGKPASAHRPQSVHIQVRGVTAVLQTDAGVFSRQGLDFGTRVLVESVTLPPNASVVDLGCGYGPVAAILGRIYPDARWLLLDINERALQLAADNTAFLGDRARVAVSDGFAAVSDERCDAVILNPPIRAGKSVVYRLFEEARAHLRPGGSLWIVIQKKQGAPSARQRLEELFTNVETVSRDGGYHVFRAKY